MAAVTLQNVFKNYEKFSAVKDLNLEIRDQEFMVLVGPSGCGKTTALRMIAGLEEISDGTIEIGTKVVNDVPPKDRDIAMVFQNYALYPHMTVFDNMAFSLKLRKTSRDEITRRVNDAAKMLNIEDLLKRRPKQLSGGQRQRVALGRAVVREPQVFLMDEPLSNLDAQLRVQTRAELIRLHRRLGITTIYVTHDQVEAMTMGDRIAVMKGGVLQQCDSPMAIYSHPVNIFVASFIGSPSMNFIKGTLQKSAGEGYTVKTATFTVATPPEHADKLADFVDKDVIFGIRPTDIYDSSRKSRVEVTAGNTVRALVDVSEPTGDQVTLYLTIGDQAIVASMESETTAKDGQNIDVVFDLPKTHLFDPVTENAIY